MQRTLAAGVLGQIRWQQIIDVYSKFDSEYSASSMCANDVGVNTDVDLGISPENDSTIHVPG